MLWIALHLPQLSLDIIERTREPATPQAAGSATHRVDIGPADPSLPAGPLLAIADRLTILCANEAAQAAGVHAGIRRATAQALLPGIELIDHDPVREQQALTSLACWALQFTPSVGFAPPPLPESGALRARARTTDSRAAAAPEAIDMAARSPIPAPGMAGLLLEVAASLRLFGGLDQMLATLRRQMLALGYRVSIGIAPTCHGAWLLARSCTPLPVADPAMGPAADKTNDVVQSLEALPERLARLPVRLLDQAQRHLGALQAIGVHTLGDLLDLPRAGLARRFGKALLLEVDAALGTQASVLDFFVAPVRFEARIELMADVERTEALLFAARRLLTELAGWLAARQAGVRSFDLILEHNTPPRTSLSVRLTDASRDPRRLGDLLRERLDILQLRTSVHTLHLQCERIQSLAPTSESLFVEHRQAAHENLGRLRERLQVRLGRGQVQRLHLAQDHRPEAAYRIQVVDRLSDLGNQGHHGNQAEHRSAESFCLRTGLLPRPLWLLRDPLPLSERNNRPWLQSALTVVAGPERIETGWWDNHLIERDYFIAEDDSNTLFWIYRERQRGWFVHGRFG